MRRLAMTSVVAAWVATTAASHVGTIAAVKLTKQDIAGKIFQRRDAVKTYRDDYIDTDVATFISKDSGFKTGLYKSGPIRYYNRGKDGYPHDEFLYLTSGSVTLTSSEGTAIVVGEGESVTLPQGWNGTFDTPGFTAIYVIRGQHPDTSPRTGRIR